MKKTILALTLVISSVTSNAYSNKRAWDASNSPRNFYQSWVGQLDQLPTKAKAANDAWSGYYWPHKTGGIAFRWDGEDNLQNPSQSSNPHNYQTPSQDEFLNMSRDQKNALSPAEKYDIFQGRFDYPTVKRERERTNPNQPLWFGVCEGWTAASIIYNQPKPFSVRIEDENTLDFTAADVKALLSYHESQFNPGVTALVGKRCEGNAGGECWDTNPATLHLALTNHIGNLKEAFAMDVDGGAEVWNQPIIAFTSKIKKSNKISAYAAQGTVRQVKVKTEVQYLQESAPLPFALNAPLIKIAKYEYTLELNQNGEIIGGEWISQTRPDFLWIPNGSNFSNSGYYKNIETLYNYSQR